MIGFGPEHLITPGTDIEYLIRFQNTGTAPADDVIIRDTLSPLFQIGSVRVGAASHPFAWEISSHGILTFHFEDIELPDSLSNEPASHGFISFKISHRADLPLGTVIPNHAGIYFDFNPPIVTNTTQHKLGVDFLEIASPAKETLVPAENALSVFPNPATQQAIVHLPVSCSTLQIFDQHGRLVRSEQVDGQKAALLQRQTLPAGIYLLRLTDANGAELGNTKLVFGW
ncbi:MAG: T9SS type A sorting domain-containing protein [Saprospiraceae bacterium]